MHRSAAAPRDVDQSSSSVSRLKPVCQIQVCLSAGGGPPAESKPMSHPYLLLLSYHQDPINTASFHFTFKHHSNNTVVISPADAVLGIHRWTVLLSPHVTDEQKGLQRLNNLPKSNQLVHGKANIQAQV